MVVLTILWSLSALGVIGLALYRKMVATREDDLIHVSPGSERLVSQQVEVSQTLDTIDKWGKMLTVVTLVVGLAIAAYYLHQAWIASQTLGE